MTQYRKKPVVIEAEQFDPQAAIWPAGVFLHDTHPDAHIETARGRGVPCIDTLEGVMRVSAGDWVITGIKGEFYSCKPDIFDATYEPVTDEPLD